MCLGFQFETAWPIHFETHLKVPGIMGRTQGRVNCAHHKLEIREELNRRSHNPFLGPVFNDQGTQGMGEMGRVRGRERKEHQKLN